MKLIAKYQDYVITVHHLEFDKNGNITSFEGFCEDEDGEINAIGGSRDHMEDFEQIVFASESSSDKQ